MSLLKYGHLQNDDQPLLTRYGGQDTTQEGSVKPEATGGFHHTRCNTESLGRAAPAHPSSSAPRPSKADGEGSASFHQSLMPRRKSIGRATLPWESPR